MSDLEMDYQAVKDSARALRGPVSNMLAEAFQAAPAAAAAAASTNMNYMTSAVLVAEFAKMASAFKTMLDRAGDHGNLLETSAQSMQDEDARRARNEFNAETTMRTYTTGGNTGRSHA